MQHWVATSNKPQQQSQVKALFLWKSIELSASESESVCWLAFEAAH